MAQRIKMIKFLDTYPTADLDIRPVDKDCIRELAELMLDAYLNTPDYEGETLNDTIKEISMVFRGYYGKFLKDASFMLFDDDGRLSSCLFICEFKTEATLTYVFTRKNQLGKGYATELIRAAENALAQLGYDRLALFVSKENLDALKLYLSLGFMEIPLNSTTLDREFLNEIREWELTLLSAPGE